MGGATSRRASILLFCAVSIAEAILWGEQPGRCNLQNYLTCRFNRRGDSLGGATEKELGEMASITVSIAEAILWGEQRGRPL